MVFLISLSLFLNSSLYTCYRAYLIVHCSQLIVHSALVIMYFLELLFHLYNWLNMFLIIFECFLLSVITIWWIEFWELVFLNYLLFLVLSLIWIILLCECSSIYYQYCSSDHFWAILIYDSIQQITSIFKYGVFTISWLNWFTFCFNLTAYYFWVLLWY